MPGPIALLMRGRVDPSWRRATGASFAAWSTALLVAVAHAAVPADVQFDPRLVFGGASAGSLAWFDHAEAVPAGRYRSEIDVNHRFAGNADAWVRMRGHPPRPEVCLDRAAWHEVRLDRRRLLPRARRWLDGHGAPLCLPAAQVARGLRATFDLSRLRVDIAAPAAVLVHRPRGWVSPRSWNDGIVAGRLNYQFNAVRSRTTAPSGPLTDSFLGLAGGVNLGAWQLRHDGTLSGTSGQGLHYTSIRSDLRHDVASLRGYVQIGQGQTDGQLLDSVGFRGIMLASDARMQPASEQGYAPRIRGFAASAATVRVTQNGTLLYQTSVPAGAFVIDDLYPPAVGAPLQVTVTQLDGRVSGFSVPVSVLPQMQRPGQSSYQLLAGRLQGSGGDARWPVVLGSLLHGFSDAVTGEVGAIGARRYRAGALGAAFNTELGAWALDLTQARFEQPARGWRSGLRERLTWSLARRASSLLLSVTRQSRGYFGPQDAMNAAAAFRGAYFPLPVAARPRQSLQGQWTLALGDQGSLFVSGSSTRYWSLAPRQTTYQLGWVRALGRAQLSVFVSRQLGVNFAGSSEVLNVGLSLPLGGGPAAPQASFGVQRDSAGATTAQWAASATAGPGGRLSYGAQVAAGGGSRSAGVDGTWRGSSGSFGAALTQSAGAGGRTRSLALNADGGVVVFGGGATFTPYLGNTIALIRADGARGAPVVGSDGARIDARGYGVATYLTPYAADTVGIDPRDATSLVNMSARVIPRAGAIVEVRLRAHRGRWVLMSAHRSSGAALPFAAQVFDDHHQLVGYVAQGSRLDVHLRRAAGSLLVRWAAGAGHACRIDYRLARAGAALRAGLARPLRLRGLVCAAVDAAHAR